MEKRPQKIQSTKMPAFRKNKWLGVFLDLVEEDLDELNWDPAVGDNLTSEERTELKEFTEADQIVIKKVTKEAMSSSSQWITTRGRYDVSLVMNARIKTYPGPLCVTSGTHQ